MQWKVSIGVLAAALLLSGLFVGVSSGQPTRISTPQEITVIEGKVLAESGRQTKVRIKDQDGTAVGTNLWDCTTTNVAWSCSNVITLKAGAHTEQGTITVSGLFAGFNGEQLAVTGGTGAYEGVGGSDTLTVEDGRYVHTLTLVP